MRNSGLLFGKTMVYLRTLMLAVRRSKATTSRLHALAAMRNSSLRRVDVPLRREIADSVAADYVNRIVPFDPTMVLELAHEVASWEEEGNFNENRESVPLLGEVGKARLYHELSAAATGFYQQRDLSKLIGCFALLCRSEEPGALKDAQKILPLVSTLLLQSVTPSKPLQPSLLVEFSSAALTLLGVRAREQRGPQAKQDSKGKGPGLSSCSASSSMGGGASGSELGADQVSLTDLLVEQIAKIDLSAAAGEAEGYRPPSATGSIRRGLRRMKPNQVIPAAAFIQPVLLVLRLGGGSRKENLRDLTTKLRGLLKQSLLNAKEALSAEGGNVMTLAAARRHGKAPSSNSNALEVERETFRTFLSTLLSCPPTVFAPLLVATADYIAECRELHWWKFSSIAKLMSTMNHSTIKIKQCLQEQQSQLPQEHSRPPLVGPLLHSMVVWILQGDRRAATPSQSSSSEFTLEGIGKLMAIGGPVFRLIEHLPPIETRETWRLLLKVFSEAKTPVVVPAAQSHGTAVCCREPGGPTPSNAQGERTPRVAFPAFKAFLYRASIEPWADPQAVAQVRASIEVLTGFLSRQPIRYVSDIHSFLWLVRSALQRRNLLTLPAVGSLTSLCVESVQHHLHLALPQSSTNGSAPKEKEESSDGKPPGTQSKTTTADASTLPRLSGTEKQLSECLWLLLSIISMFPTQDSPVLRAASKSVAAVYVSHPHLIDQVRVVDILVDLLEQDALQPELVGAMEKAFRKHRRWFSKEADSLFRSLETKRPAAVGVAAEKRDAAGALLPAVPCTLEGITKLIDRVVVSSADADADADGDQDPEDDEDDVLEEAVVAPDGIKESLSVDGPAEEVVQESLEPASEAVLTEEVGIASEGVDDLLLQESSPRVAIPTSELQLDQKEIVKELKEAGRRLIILFPALMAELQKSSFQRILRTSKPRVRYQVRDILYSCAKVIKTFFYLCAVQYGDPRLPFSDVHLHLNFSACYRVQLTLPSIPLSDQKVRSRLTATLLWYLYARCKTVEMAKPKEAPSLANEVVSTGEVSIDDTALLAQSATEAAAILQSLPSLISRLWKSLQTHKGPMDEGKSRRSTPPSRGNVLFKPLNAAARRRISIPLARLATYQLNLLLHFLYSRPSTLPTSARVVPQEEALMVRAERFRLLRHSMSDVESQLVAALGNLLSIIARNFIQDFYYFHNAETLLEAFLCFTSPGRGKVLASVEEVPAAAPAPAEGHQKKVGMDEEDSLVDDGVMDPLREVPGASDLNSDGDPNDTKPIADIQSRLNKAELHLIQFVGLAQFARNPRLQIEVLERAERFWLKLRESSGNTDDRHHQQQLRLLENDRFTSDFLNSVAIGYDSISTRAMLERDALLLEPLEPQDSVAGP